MKPKISRFHAPLIQFRIGSSALVLAVAVSSLAVQSAQADATWVGDSGQNWNTAASWSSDPANPTGNFIINTATAGIFPIVSANSAFVPVDIIIANGGSNSGRLDQTTGSLSLANVTTNGNWFFAGRNANTASGIYNLADTAGTGGALTGFGTGSGSLTVGKLFAGGAYFFNGGTGTININTSGTVTANSTQNISNTGPACVILATGAGSFGTINLDNGTIQANGELWVGNGGTASLKQSGGIVNTTGVLYIGRNSGSIATLNMTGGTVNAAAVDVGWGTSNVQTQQGTVTLGTGATLNSEGEFRTGFAGSATAQANVNVNGGTLNIGSATKRSMSVGQYDVTNSTITVNSGSLNLNTNSDLRMKTGDNGGGTNIVNLNGGSITSFSDNKVTANGAGVVDLMNSGTATTSNTFNLNSGGTLTILKVITTTDLGTAAFNFNGGILKASGNATDFMNLGGATQSANVLAGGAKIDSNAHNVTILQPLVSSGADGGLTKQGAGVLTLAGANTYTGATNVDAGTLELTGSLTSNITVKTDATVTGTGINTGSLTMNTGSTLSASTSGAFEVNGVTFAGATTLSFNGIPTNGTQYVLLKYGAGGVSGLGNFSSPGFRTVITNDTANSQLLGTVTTADLTWNSTAGTWAKGGSGWTGGFTSYFNGDTVTFNERPGASVITLSGSLTPADVTVNNTTNPYTFTGSGTIDGATGLTKNGTGALTIATANSYSGGTTLNAGTLNINNPTALGTGLFTINGGTINNTSGAAIVMTANNPQNWDADVTFTGTNDLNMGTGAVTVGGDGTDRAVTVSGGTLTVGPISAFSHGLIKSGSGALRLSGGNSTISGILNVQAGTLGSGGDVFANGLTGSGTFENGSGASKWSFWTITEDQTTSTLIQNGGGAGLLGIVKRGAGTWTLTNNNNNATSNLQVDEGKLVLNNTGTYGRKNPDGSTNIGAASYVGNTGGANVVLEINGATVNYNNSDNADDQPYRLSLVAGNNASGTGAIKLNSGTLSTRRELGLGVSNGTFGAMTQTGGTTTVGGFVNLGSGNTTAGVGVLNLTGGTFNHNGPLTVSGNGTLGIGVLNISGAADYNYNNASGFGFWVGENGSGTLNITGSATLTLASAGNGITLGQNSTGTGTLNLLGGTVTANSITKGAGTGTLNFNGGTLKANAASSTFLAGITSAYVRGGTVDNGGNAITIGQALLAPTGNGVSASGLTVSGGGFIDTPAVTITGDGTGATAVANINSTGDLTGITITNPGTGYTTAPTVTLVGGGIGNTGSVGGAATLVANTSGGMAFRGAATTTLSGVNTYTGNTTVNSGSTLLLGETGQLKFAPGANGTTNKVTGTGTATFDGNFNINLTDAAIANNNSWTLVDVNTKEFNATTFNVVGFTETAPGVHTLVDSNKTWTFTEATGVLSLQVSAGGFASWISGFGLAAGDQDPTDDPDNDGFTNLMEYVLGGNPNSSSTSIQPNGSKLGSNFILTFTRNDLALTGGDVGITLQYGTGLAAWDATVAVPATSSTVGGVSFNVTDGSPNDTITATIPNSSATKFFARIKAVK